MKLKLSTLSLLSISLISGLFFPVSILAAGDYPTCAPNTVCVIGEFLYDDEYAPIATATCTLTARDPAGALFLNSQTMSPSADGWYQTTVSTASAVGVYRSQVCCTAGADYLCLDKTFQVVATASALTASDVWSFSGRSLDDYGTLISDIWNNGTRTLSSYGDIASDVWGYSSRSLNSFGTLISGIWDYGTRTITGGGDTVNNTYNNTNNYSGTVTTYNNGNITNTSNITTSQIQSLTTVNTETRQLLEQLINKPVVQTFTDEGGPDLQTKIEKTTNIASRLYGSIQNLKSRGELLSLKWAELNQSEIITELETINSVLRENNLSENSSIIANTNWLKTAWDSAITLGLSDQAQAAQGKIDNLLSDLRIFGKKSSPLTFASILKHIEYLDTLLGNSLNVADDPTLYGYLEKVQRLVENYNQQTITAKDLLAKLNSAPQTDLDSAISELDRQILASNQIPQAETVLTPGIRNEKNDRKNKVLGLLALIDTNLRALASFTGKTVSNIWLEEGSIVFRAVITNPSKTISQTVPVEIFLPEEIKKEQVTKSDPALTIDFNTEKNRLVASGKVVLIPLQTRTFLVEVEDIWQFSQEEVNILKKQAKELHDATRNTTFFAQSVSLKSDIDAQLEKIMLHQKEAITPENRIQTYRESRLEMAAVGEKMAALKDIVVQANASGSIFGFVGGVQAIAIWGLVIILLTGFVFLSLYMRAMYQDQHRFASSTILPSAPRHELPPPAFTPKQNLRKTSLSRARRLTNLGLIFLLAGSFTSLGTSIILSAARKNSLAGLISPLVTEGLVLGSSNPKPGQEVK